MVSGGAMNSKPPVIGLIGGIGSGKSTVGSILETLGCIVACADDNANAIIERSEIQEQLVRWWGEDVLLHDGNVDKKAIASIVFKDDAQRLRLEALLHPLIYQMQEEQFALADSHTQGLVIDAPLLIEAGLDTMCEALVFVDAALETRQKRVIKGRGWSVDEIIRRESTQLPLDTKRKKADYVVINEGNLDEVQKQVKQILEDIQRRQLS